MYDNAFHLSTMLLSHSSFVLINDHTFIADVLAFYVTWFFPTISRFLDFAGEKNYAIQFLDTLLLPLQGFFNCFVYLRPSIQRYRRRNPTANICAALGAVITNHD